MFEELKKQNIIIELKNLVDTKDDVNNDDIGEYCEFMKQNFLATSGLN